MFTSLSAPCSLRLFRFFPRPSSFFSNSSRTSTNEGPPSPLSREIRATSSLSLSLSLSQTKREKLRETRENAKGSRLEVTSQPIDRARWDVPVFTRPRRRVLGIIAWKPPRSHLSVRSSFHSLHIGKNNTPPPPSSSPFDIQFRDKSPRYCFKTEICP